MPGSQLRVFYRGEFATAASLRASIRSMNILPLKGKKNGQNATSRLIDYMVRCQWTPESIQVILTPDVGSLTCYAANMVTESFI